MLDNVYNTKCNCTWSNGRQLMGGRWWCISGSGDGPNRFIFSTNTLATSKWGIIGHLFIPLVFPQCDFCQFVTYHVDRLCNYRDQICHHKRVNLDQQLYHDGFILITVIGLYPIGGPALGQFHHSSTMDRTDPPRALERHWQGRWFAIQCFCVPGKLY